MNNGVSFADHAIEERRFAHIRSANNRDNRFHFDLEREKICLMLKDRYIQETVK